LTTQSGHLALYSGLPQKDAGCMMLLYSLQALYELSSLFEIFDQLVVVMVSSPGIFGLISAYK
jgi:hypothetical protein